MIPKRFSIWLVGLALVGLIGMLAGCSNTASVALTGSSWPGVTVSDDTIYLAAGPRVYAIRSSTGETLWAFPEQIRRGQTFYAPPAVSDDLVVVVDYVNSVFALDRDIGTEKWAFQGGARFIGGAVIGEKYVYAGSTAGVLYALDRETGNEVWSFAAAREIWATPLLDAETNTLYVTSLDRHVFALDAETGELKWQFPEEGADEGDVPMGAIAGTPSLYDGVLYFGSFNNRVYALDATTREVLWTYTTSNWVWSSPVKDEQTGLLIGGDLDGHIFALDPNTGRAVWTFSAEGPVVSPPAIGELDGERVLYATSGDTKLYILRVSDGTQAVAPVTVEAQFTTRFLFFPTGTTTRNIPLLAPPILHGDLILIGAHQGDHPLIALDRDALVERWAFSPPSS